MSVPDAKYYASRKWKTADWKKAAGCLIIQERGHSEVVAI